MSRGCLSSREAHERRVVLMHAVHGHAIGRGAGRAGKGGAPREMGVVHQPRPVDGAHHDRLIGAEEDVANRLERIVDCVGRFDPSAEQGVPERWCNVEAEGRDAERGRDFRFRIYDL